MNDKDKNEEEKSTQSNIAKIVEVSEEEIAILIPESIIRSLGWSEGTKVKVCSDIGHIMLQRAEEQPLPQGDEEGL